MFPIDVGGWLFGGGGGGADNNEFGGGGTPVETEKTYNYIPCCRLIWRT